MKAKKVLTIFGIVTATIALASVGLTPIAQGGVGHTISRVTIGGSDTPSTTIPSSPAPSPPTGASGVLPSSVSPPTTLTHLVPPKVALIGGSCVDSDVTAAVSGNGPYFGMGTNQLIVSLSSTGPCTLSGFPVLTFLNGQGKSTGAKFSDGGTTGATQLDAMVELNAGQPVSFLIQFGDIGCVPASQLVLALPGTTPVNVALDPSFMDGWSSCAVVSETPYVQGNSMQEYA